MDPVTTKANRKEWRKALKKQQRQRRRQAAAKERDRKLEEEEVTRLKDPIYQEWLQQQNALAELQRIAAEQQHAEEEEAWLRRELLAQQAFRRELQRRAAEDAAQETIRLQQQKEYKEREAAKRKKREESEQLKAAAVAEFEQTMQLMEAYLSNELMPQPPAQLCRIVETKPGQKLCEFYERTSCCRFGAPCVFNHRRPMLSTIIVIRHFFVHPLLEQQKTTEYANADAALELCERDLRDDYDAFFEDVVPEMERFGKIMNFRTMRNVQKHLRGHVFVEFLDERSALKAFVNLQGRFYATRRLNVEFSNLKTWRGAICGLSLTRKCPKGHSCNYLHLLSNPDNKYNTLLEYTKPTPYRQRQVTTPLVNISTPLLNWDDISAGTSKQQSRSWRWSESPEVEVKANNNEIKLKKKTSEKAVHNKRKSRDRQHSSSSSVQNYDVLNEQEKQNRRGAEGSKKLRSLSATSTLRSRPAEKSSDISTKVSSSYRATRPNSSQSHKHSKERLHSDTTVNLKSKKHKKKLKEKTTNIKVGHDQKAEYHYKIIVFITIPPIQN